MIVCTPLCFQRRISMCEPGVMRILHMLSAYDCTSEHGSLEILKGQDEVFVLLLYIGSYSSNWNLTASFGESK